MPHVVILYTGNLEAQTDMTALPEEVEGAIAEGAELYSLKAPHKIEADENGNVICYDVSWSDKLYCDFTPAWDGYFYVTVQNMGGSRNSYYLMTN